MTGCSYHLCFSRYFWHIRNSTYKRKQYQVNGGASDSIIFLVLIGASLSEPHTIHIVNYAGNKNKNE